MTQPPDYSLFFTDGDQNHLPNEKELRQGYKSTDDYDLTKKALSIFAVEMAKRLETNIDKGTIYSKIPTGYSAWPCPRQGSESSVERSKIDWYIFGHPNHKKFDSFAQFSHHIYFLQQQQPPEDCPCKVCLKHPLTAQTVVYPDPAPASMISPSEEVGPKKDKPSHAPKAQTDAAPSSKDAKGGSRRQKPIPSGEEVEEEARAASSTSKALSTKRHSRHTREELRAKAAAIFGEDSEDEAVPKIAKHPAKRRSHFAAMSEKPSKRVRTQRDEEEGLNIGGDEVAGSEAESPKDSDAGEKEIFVPDQDVLYHQELFAQVKKIYDQQLFIRIKEKKRFDEPMNQMIDTNFNTKEEIVHQMLTELPQQGSYVFRIGEIVAYLPDAKTIFRQEHIDGEFWLEDYETGKLLGRPPWLAGVVAQVPDRVVTPRMLGEEHGEETFPLHRSRYLIEPLPEMASSKKDTGLASIYVPFRNICPFAYAIDIHKGRPTSSYHGSMFCAMERMATLSLVYRQYVRAKWPHALMYYGGIYLGAELLVVGDAVRIESNFKIKGCYEILIINSIKLRFNGIQPEPNGRTVTGKRADFQRLYFRGHGFTTDKNHPHVGEPIEANIHPAMRQQQDAVKWYRIGNPDDEMEVDFSRVIGRLFESAVVMKWFARLWHANMEAEAINYGHEGVLQMRQLARMRSPNLGWDPNDNKGEKPRWFWARDRVHALDLIYQGKREVGEADRMGGLDTHTHDSAELGLRNPLSWRSIVMKVDRDNAVGYPGKETVDRPRKLIGTETPKDKPTKFRSGRYYSFVNGETFDKWTRDTDSIMDNEDRKARRKALQKWWNGIFFLLY